LGGCFSVAAARFHQHQPVVPHLGFGELTKNNVVKCCKYENPIQIPSNKKQKLRKHLSIKTSSKLAFATFFFRNPCRNINRLDVPCKGFNQF
jgi:hypothetical protein